MHTQRMLKETGLSNEVKIVKTKSIHLNKLYIVFISTACRSKLFMYL